MRISKFSSLFSVIAVFLALSGKMFAENAAIARKRDKKSRNPHLFNEENVNKGGYRRGVPLGNRF